LFCGHTVLRGSTTREPPEFCPLVVVRERDEDAKRSPRPWNAACLAARAVAVRHFPGWTCTLAVGVTDLIRWARWGCEAVGFAGRAVAVRDFARGACALARSITHLLARARRRGQAARVAARAVAVEHLAGRARRTRNASRDVAVAVRRLSRRT